MLNRLPEPRSLYLLFGAIWCLGHPLRVEADVHERVENAKSGPRDSRGNPMPQHAIGRLGTLCLRQNDAAIAVAYSPDGKTLASRTNEGSIHLWDAGTGDELWVHHFFETAGSMGGQVAFSPDGKRMATVGREGAHIWELASKRSMLLSKVPIPISFSPDSRQAVGVIDRDLVIIELESGSIKARLATNTNLICPAVFSPNGKLIAFCDWPSNKDTPLTIRFWDVSTGKQAGELVSPQHFIKSLNFSPDGKLLVSADPTKGVRPYLWDVTRRKEIATVEHPAASLALFSPDGKLLATSDDSHVRLWDTSTLKEVRSMNSFATVTWWRAMAFSPNGKKLLTAGNSHALKLWDVETGREVFPSSGHPFAVKSLQFAPDGKILASQDRSRTVCFWELAGKKESHRLQFEQNGGFSRRSMRPGYSLAISPDVKAVATYLGGIDKRKPSSTVRVWDTATRDVLFDLPTPQGSGVISFSPDGQILATAFNGIGFRFWSINSRKLLREIADDKHAPLEDLTFAPDGRTFATTGRKQRNGNGLKKEFIPEILLWNWTNGRLIRDFPSQKYATYLTFSPSSQMLASCCYWGDPTQNDNTIRLWEAVTGSLIRTLEGQESSASCAAFSPNGRLLASACPIDRAVRIWDVFTGKELAKFAGHRGPVYCVAFSPDGKTVASGSADTTILLWDVSKLQPDQPPSIARNEVPKELARLWEQMQEKEGAKAYQAIWRLIGAGDDAVAFLDGKLHSVPAPDTKLLNQAIADLNSGDFAKREAGTAHLSKLAELAEPALWQALQSKPSLEVRKRIENILAGLVERPFHELELHQIRALNALELIGSPAALEVLKKLASGAAGARLTRDTKLALQRLERRSNMPGR